MPPGILPELVRSGTRIGTVDPAAATATGIPAGTPVISGMTDGCAAQLGAGVLEPGDWNSVLGTTLVLNGVTRELLRDPSAVVYSHRSPDGGWLPGGASSTGAGVIARDYSEADLAALNQQASRHEPSPMLTYPLAGRGERFPFVAPQAHAFQLGGPGTAAERYAAVLQGVAYIERLCVDYLDHLGAPVDGAWVITGGATRNTYWNQLRADVLARPVSMPDNAEPALGMAVLAASAQRPLSTVASEMVRIRDVIEPRVATARRYDEPYLRLVEELEGRGWLATEAAAHARERTTRLVLVRHGETVWHQENRYAGTTDVALTDRGWEQARQLADWARTAGLAGIWASTLSRVASTPPTPPNASPAACATSPPNTPAAGCSWWHTRPRSGSLSARSWACRPANTGGCSRSSATAA